MTPTSPERARTIRCPACGGKSRYAADNTYRPFCSERCRTHDLGAWASESYRVAKGSEATDDDSEPSPGAPRH